MRAISAATFLLVLAMAMVCFGIRLTRPAQIKHCPPEVSYTAPKGCPVLRGTVA